MQRRNGLTVHASFRVSADVRRELQKEAIRRKISFNSLGNRILEKYLSFDRLVEHEHSVVIERKVFSRILEKIAVEDLQEIGRELGQKAAKEDFEFFGIPPTLGNLITRYFEPIGAFSDRYDSNIVGDAPYLKIVLAHEYGHKWSIFLGEHSIGVVESILGAKPNIEIGEDVVTIQLWTPDA
ncbi:MAG TPA: hypothetical protein VGR56_05850 [Nitrososphaerales archaeon]|nr:hypothetical protein [Nitrososphaerales archaeon]